MLWHAMPPELNTARLMAGAGPAPMLQAAAGWEALASSLQAQAAELGANLLSLKSSWSGSGSDRALAAATPMVAWLEDASQQAKQRGTQAAAQAAAYMKALGMTPSLPEIVSNQVTHAVLSATNFLGINLVPIGFNETDYFVRMWNQAGGAMNIYQAETAANTAFESLAPMKAILQTTVGQAMAQTLRDVTSSVSRSVPGVLGALTDAAEMVPVPAAGEAAQGATQLLNQIGLWSGPMQQLLQPLQQLTSLAGQTSAVGGSSSFGDGLIGGKAGELGAGGLGQMGLLGASPLSSHPLAGGSGPTMGMGLMHAEALPGSGGSAARTTLMSQLLDKGGVAPAAAGASAMGGAAPIGMAGAGTRPALATATPLAARGEEGGYDDRALAELDDQDDW